MSHTGGGAGSPSRPIVMRIDHTNDPSFRSWLPADADHAWPLQLLPYGVITTEGPRLKAQGSESMLSAGATPRLAVAIGEHALDLRALAATRLLDGLPAPLVEAVRAPSLNPLLALSPPDWTALRHRLFSLLVDDAAGQKEARDSVRACLVSLSQVRMHLPIAVGDYTDFYASIHHATNVGTMLRPEQPLLPNYRHVPIGYHGRASSIVVSGTPIRRPCGQILPAGAITPVFGASRRLDYELEVGLVIGGEKPLGEPVPISRAHERLFGIVLLNDWSARDIQAWEYQPLGPFLGKSFATSISAWVVPMDALASRRCAVAPREPEAPAPLPYLLDADDQARGAIDLDLEVQLSSSHMREAGLATTTVSRSNLRDLYWTPAQMVAHHTSNGCNLRPGDLLGTGTVSGEVPESRGCLLERTWRGTEPLTLPTGEERRFLEDGDQVRLMAWSTLECLGSVSPAIASR